MTTKKTAMKTALGRKSIKNQQLIRSSKLFSGLPVLHLIYTLLKVWGCPNLKVRASNIMVVAQFSKASAFT